MTLARNTAEEKLRTPDGGHWTLRLCASCKTRRMMPATNSSCLACEEKIKRKRRGRQPAVEVPALKMLREARQLTVTELARKSDVTYTTVMRLERSGGK